MDIQNILLVVITSLVSGIIGVIISNRHFSKLEQNKFKRDICLQLIANRHNLIGNEFTQALNSIVFAFNDDKDTIQNFISFTDVVTKGAETQYNSNEELLKLIKAMLKNLNMEAKDIDNKYYLITFNNQLPELRR